MHRIIHLLMVLVVTGAFGQSLLAQHSLKGQLVDEKGEAVPFANVVLYKSPGNELYKAEASDMEGHFVFLSINPADYILEISFLGLEDIRQELKINGQDIDLGTMSMKTAGIQIETTIVTARRALMEVKPDKTVFNVEGTINSAGENAIGLLRKAPGVLLDNNDNITVLGRSGVKVYIDGKILPLAGEELTNYLESLSSEQIDRIDIISNPGAKYEAEGNAGIIDIRLKKSKNAGSNGTLSSSFSQGVHSRYNVNLGGNSRSDKLNLYGNASYNINKGFSDMFFETEQNGLFLNESNHRLNDRNGYDAKIGMDYFLDAHNTIGVLVSGGQWNRIGESVNRIEISPLLARQEIDSVLVAYNQAEKKNEQETYNLNYMFTGKGNTFNVDLDYGRYRNSGTTAQPNTYYDASGQNILSSDQSEYDTPVEIDIYTLKLDYENPLWGGTFGTGTKLSKVRTDNTYLFYNIDSEERSLVTTRSNNFLYDEMVYAGYVNYARQVNKKLSFSGGVRVEYTDATGDLVAYDPALQEDPVILKYVDYFPSLGISYGLAPGNSINLNYGRRLNRPDYNVLNPFKEQQSELSFSKGNPYLDPEIVNNYEIGYTHGYRYNFKLSYSRTIDQITRLIGPDDIDPRAGFITWDNLATKDVASLNVALPFQFYAWWNAFFNLTGSYINNQADYGGDAIVDLQAWSYNVYSQQSFNLPLGISAEISGWYSGPGIWGGVFRYEPSWSLDVGLQRKFMKDQLNVKLSGNDLFNQSGWRGVSKFNGQTSYGRGNWDSRRISLTISYSFGNSKIKSRNRKTGIEEETGRISS